MLDHGLLFWQWRRILQIFIAHLSRMIDLMEPGRNVDGLGEVGQNEGLHLQALPRGPRVLSQMHLNVMLLGGQAPYFSAKEGDEGERGFGIDVFVDAHHVTIDHTPPIFILGLFKFEFDVDPALETDDKVGGGLSVALLRLVHHDGCILGWTTTTIGEVGRMAGRGGRVGGRGRRGRGGRGDVGTFRESYPWRCAFG